MKKYVLDAVEVASQGAFVDLALEGKDLLYAVEGPARRPSDTFSTPEEYYDLRAHFAREWAALIRPFGKSANLFAYLVVAVIGTCMTFTGLTYFLYRGWRLDVVRRIGGGVQQEIPPVDINSSFRYLGKGIVLAFWRGVYFVPLIICAYFSSLKVLRMLLDVVYFVIERIGNADASFVNFVVVKIIPQFTINALVTLIALALYAVFVWPVYRILMMRYALGNMSGTGFIKLADISRAWGVFRRNAPDVYGVYGFAMAVDVASFLFFNTLGLLSFGFLFVLVPIANLFFRFWLKGYAYGRLAQRLVQRGELEPLKLNRYVY